MTSFLACVSALAGLAACTLTIEDPSDVIGVFAWEADNALIADYNVVANLYQTDANVAPVEYVSQNISVKHHTYTVDKNDTSVVLVTNGSSAYFDYDTFVKFGYTSNLVQASFFGLNAALWVGNESTAHLSNSNITVHNGAANIFVYGEGSVLYVDNTFLYSSGPTSHGLYAAGNGTIYAENIDHYSGGMRSSAFSGDNPAGYVHVKDSVAHTDGVGSAICYALGLCNITNVVGHAARAPAMFMDSDQEGIWTNCDLTAGFLAGMILFSSRDRATGGSVTLDHSRLTVLGETMPSLWFGNTVATASIISSQLNNSASGLLAIANTSQVTQDFDHFAGYEENSAIQPAEVVITVEESSLSGDIIAYNGSSIELNLTGYSSWEGKAYSGYGEAYFGVHLDASSTWVLTGNTSLQNFTTASANVSNVVSNGFSIEYNSSSSSNSWIGGKTVCLGGGGWLVPS